MNELELFSAINQIDSDLISEADTPPPLNRPKFYITATMAAAAVITAGAAVICNSEKPADTLSSMRIQQNDPPEGNVPESHSVTSAAAIPQVTSEAQPASENVTITENVSAVNNEKNVTTENNEQTDIPPATTESAGEISDIPDDVSEPLTEAADKNTKDNQNDLSLKPFSATKDPDSDSFHEEEAPHIDVTTSEATYRQLEADEYAAYNISSISENDLGDPIGIIVETNSSEYHGNAVESQEPNIAGAEAYFYAPAKSKSVIIVKKGTQCSAFVCDLNLSSGFEAGFSFFGAESTNDVVSVSYRVQMPDGSTIKSVSQGTVTDRSELDDICAVLYQLHPTDTSSLPAHIGTPQWLVDAYDERRNSSDPEVWKSVDININFSNGTSMRGIIYSPYLGTGYISGMDMLTPEQNLILKEIFE